MAKYKITACVGLDIYSTVVDAPNHLSAHQKALELGYSKSNFGKRYLRYVKAVRIPNKKQ